MLVNKITVGFVVQVFDTEKKRFVGQEFVAGDQCDYEDNGELVGREMLEVDGKEAYLPFDMVQPHTEDEGDARGKQADRPRHCKTVRVPVEIAFTSDPAELDNRKDEPAPTRESLLAWLQDALVLQVDTEGNGQPKGAVFAGAGIDWDAATLIETNDHLG